MCRFSQSHLLASNLAHLLGRLRGALISRHVCVSTIQKGEVGKLLLIHHVDATVKHYCAPANFRNYAGATDILACAQRHDFNWHCLQALINL